MIEHSSGEFLQNFTMLNGLFVKGNNLTELTENILKNQTDLKTLYLKGTKLMALPNKKQSHARSQLK